MAERNFYGLRDIIGPQITTQRNRPKNTKDSLYKFIDDAKRDDFFETMYRWCSNNRRHYKLVFFYGIGPPTEDQSVWIKLIKSNRISWMKDLASNLMLDLRPIMICLSNNTPISSLNYAIEQKNSTAVKCMLELQSKYFNGKIDKHPFCPALIKCVKNWDVEVAKVLIEYGFNVNQTTKTGNTGLHFASEKNNLTAVEFLIEQGAEVNAQNSKGKSPLHLAVSAELKPIAKKLMDAGAVLLKDKLNHTPLFYAVLIDNKRSEPNPINETSRYNRRKLMHTQVTINLSKELCQNTDLFISDVVSMLSMNLVPLHDSERYCRSMRHSMLVHTKHGIKPILNSQFVKYPEARNISQAEKVDENPILQVLYSSVVWTSSHRTSINSSTMRSRLLLYLTILLNSSSFDQCYRRHLRTLITFAYQCFLQPFPSATKNSSRDEYFNRTLRQAWKEFTCLIMLTQHFEMPLKQVYLEHLETYLNSNIMPLFKIIERMEDSESLFISLQLICIPIHLFLYLWWQTTRSPSDHYFKSFIRIKNYVDYFYPYYLMHHDILTAIVSITCYDSHKLRLNATLHKEVGHELGNFAMIENNSFDVKITDMIDFLVDLQIDMNFRSPTTGNSGLHVAAKEVLSNELLHLLDVGTYPLTLDKVGNTFYQYAHENPNSFQENERKMILSHPSIEGLAPPKLETLCALAITKNNNLCQFALDLLPNTRYSKLIYLHTPSNCYSF